METPLVRDAIRQIQDLVAEATGQMLQGDAERRLASVLEGFRAGPDAKIETTERNFSDREVTILIAERDRKDHAHTGDRGDRCPARTEPALQTLV